MHIYNVTINIDDAAHSEWLIWMESYVLEMLNTGKFSVAKMTEVLVNSEVGRTYSVQYSANSKEDLEQFYTSFEDKFRLKAYQKFGDKMVTFATELKLVKEFYPTIKKN